MEALVSPLYIYLICLYHPSERPSRPPRWVQIASTPSSRLPFSRQVLRGPTSFGRYRMTACRPTMGSRRSSCLTGTTHASSILIAEGLRCSQCLFSGIHLLSSTVTLFFLGISVSVRFTAHLARHEELGPLDGVNVDVRMNTVICSNTLPRSSCGSSSKVNAPVMFVFLTRRT